MAVQQNKKSPSKRGMHRSHDFLVAPRWPSSRPPAKVHLRHHVSPSGVLPWQEGCQGQGRVILPGIEDGATPSGAAPFYKPVITHFPMAPNDCHLAIDCMGAITALR